MSLTLNVKLLTGEVHSVVCSPNGTVWDFKTRLGLQSGVPPYQQKLGCPNAAHLDLQDGAPLAKYGLRDGDTLLLMVKSEESIPVLLRNSNNRTSTYHVLPSDTVQRFRAQIRAQEGVQDDQFWLVYESQTLEDGRKLSDYNICPGGTVTLNLRVANKVPWRVKNAFYYEETPCGSQTPRWRQPNGNVLSLLTGRQELQYMGRSGITDQSRRDEGMTFSLRNSRREREAIIHPRRDDPPVRPKPSLETIDFGLPLGSSPRMKSSSYLHLVIILIVVTVTLGWCVFYIFMS